MKTTALRHHRTPLTAHGVAPSQTIHMYHVWVERVRALLRRVRRVDTRALTALPAAILEHMQVREWAEDVRVSESRMFDHLLPNTGGFTRSQGLNVGSNWQ